MSKQAPYLTVAAVVTAGAIGGAYYAYKLYKETRRVKLPQEWRQVGTLKGISIFPVKSCGPVVLSEAECSLLGLKDGWLRDRVLMVTDQDNHFITSRGYGELLNIQASVKGSILTLMHKAMETLHVGLAEVAASQKTQKAIVWGIQVPVYDCGQEASEWFTKLLSVSTKQFKLMYYASERSRNLPKSACEIYQFTKDDAGAFTDEISYHVVNEASVEDLNTRMKDYKATMANFRPNLVITGPKAYEEDDWKFMKIGDNIFEIVKPCFRCVVTTIDPETGVRKPQVLDTLRSYRQAEEPEVRRAEGNAPRMGLSMALRSTPGGVVKLNDAVYVA